MDLSAKGLGPGPQDCTLSSPVLGRVGAALRIPGVCEFSHRQSQGSRFMGPHCESLQEAPGPQQMVGEGRSHRGGCSPLFHASFLREHRSMAEHIPPRCGGHREVNAPCRKEPQASACPHTLYRWPEDMLDSAVFSHSRSDSRMSRDSQRFTPPLPPTSPPCQGASHA